MYMFWTSLTEYGGVQVVELGADERLRQLAEVVQQRLEHVQLKATVDRHPSHKLLCAAIRPWQEEGGGGGGG